MLGSRSVLQFGQFGFVWSLDLAEELDIFQCAVETALETGFVACQESEFRTAAEFGEASGDGVAGPGLFSGGFGEEIGFDATETALAPDGGGEIFDESDFDAVGGVDPVNVLL